LSDHAAYRSWDRSRRVGKIALPDNPFPGEIMHAAFPPADDLLQPPTPPGAALAPGGRPCWSGLLQFSLVGIPLKAYPAVRTRDVPVGHLLHAHCGRRLRYAKHCPTHGPVEAAAVVRGFEYGPGRHVVVEADELDRLRPAAERALRLERFVTPAQVDPLLYGGRSLYLLPDGPAAESGYGVLLAALRQRGRWALGRVVLSGLRQVVLLRPTATVLVLHVLHYSEQVRPCPPQTPRRPAEVSEELRLAGQLIDAASGAVDWDAYRDAAAHELKALLEAKLQGRGGAALEPAAAVRPLLETLRRGVAAAAAADGPTRSPVPRRTPRKPGRRIV
jgi:DNA end-binding protein Ku